MALKTVTVELTGPGGSGKTTLLKHFADRLELAGFYVIDADHEDADECQALTMATKDGYTVNFKTRLVP